MYLSRTAEYALRTTACLARLTANSRVRAKDLAPLAGVPLPYLSKILRRLTASGLLTSQKGHHGGFALARRPDEIRFVDVLRAVDFEPAADHCLFGWENCDAANPCPLHPEWADLKETIEQWARSRTLADVLRGQTNLTETGEEPRFS
jgi:Rrf2 family protein